jgi:hypothetical protein
VPITAKLSKRFYDRLGEDVVNELVGLLNLIDSTYRSELREVNDANWARFEAKLEFEVARVRADFKADMAAFRGEIRADMAELRETLERRLGEQTRWMFVVWAALLVPIIGLWFR